ncbi:MAG: hypothetical protein U1E54_01275 [Candidatus Levybacteria bacterium]|nr:hypothetical protein [Candidatus Levybacteria bacterium]
MAKTENMFDEKNEIRSTRISWGKVGDNIIGTLVGKRMVPDTFKVGEEVPVYEFKADSGSFHEIVKKIVAVDPTEITPGDIWAVFGRGALVQAMARIKMGQKVGLKFVEEKETKKGNDMKVIKVYTSGVIDTEWLEGQEVDLSHDPS